MAKKIIIGNWKMEPASLREAVLLSGLIKKGLSSQKNTIVLCPPNVYLSEIFKDIFKTNNIKLGAQDCFCESCGAFTGEVSPTMLKSVGVKYVLVGHSERRSMGESDEYINKKIKLALKSGLKTIFCVGEKERDVSGLYLKNIEEQIRSGLVGINRKYFKDLIVAYEPVWAIGQKAKGSCEPKEIKEMSIFIKKNIADISSRDVGLKIPVVYGGSVDTKNASKILSEGEVDGLLIGRASVDSRKFLEIIRSAESV